MRLRRRTDSARGEYEYAELARYNTDRSRGVLFDAETMARMALQQTQFDREMCAEFIAQAHAKGHAVYAVPGGGMLSAPRGSSDYEEIWS